ncbi:hypothetical protein Efla_000001 [Eimeria flavescens]
MCAASGLPFTACDTIRLSAWGGNPQRWAVSSDRVSQHAVERIVHSKQCFIACWLIGQG